MQNKKRREGVFLLLCLCGIIFTLIRRHIKNKKDIY